MKKALLFVLAIVTVLSVCTAVFADDLPTVKFWTTGSQNVQDVFTEVVNAYNAKEDRLGNLDLQFILSVPATPMSAPATSLPTKPATPATSISSLKTAPIT